MLLERSMHPDFLSNSYLIAPDSRSDAVYIDAGGPMGPLLEAAERNELTPSRVLLTHHHFDHVSEAAGLGLPMLAHPIEADLIEGDVETIEPGDTIEVGELRIESLHTPGHTAGMLSFVVEGAVFTGDTLFRNSVGGVRAPGATSFEDLKHSIMDVLMELPPETIIYPGHTDSSTVAEEWDNNPFIRLWRGLDDEGTEKCTVWEQEATLVLWAPDYDGGHKAWVRWTDGRDDIVPGSQVQRP